MTFTTDSNRPQPLRRTPPTACLTAPGAASEVPSLLMHPWWGGGGGLTHNGGGNWRGKGGNPSIPVRGRWLRAMAVFPGRPGGGAGCHVCSLPACPMLAFRPPLQLTASLLSVLLRQCHRRMPSPQTCLRKAPGDQPSAPDQLFLLSCGLHVLTVWPLM